MNDPIEKHVVSLELARALKEKGFSQNTSFSFFKLPSYPGFPLWETNGKGDLEKVYAEEISEIISSPLATELGEKLPPYVPYNGKTFWIWAGRNSVSVPSSCP